MQDVRRLLLAAGLLATSLVGPALAAERPRVVVLGFDGADGRLVERWMDEGELPHLARLRAEGGFAPLEPTNPPQTPVSWSSFATGADPGRTEIFDFVKRDPETYAPDVAMTREGKRPFLFGPRNGSLLGGGIALAVFVVALLLGSLLVRRALVRVALALALAALAGSVAGLGVARFLPEEVPDTQNNRRGRTLWEMVGEAGLRAQVIRVPATFPAENAGPGNVLSGLGVPDVRGRAGTPSYYTSDPNFDPRNDEFKLEPIKLPARRGRIETRIVGPANKAFYDFVVNREVEGLPATERRAARREARRRLDEAGVPARLDLPLTIEATDTDVVIEVAGRSATMRVGEWSDWVEMPFPVNPVMDRVAPLVGMGRFKLLALEPHLELYLSPVNYHPDCHPVAFAWPPDFSETLRERFGLYKTIGWALDTWSLPSGVGDEELFLEDMRFTVTRFGEIMEGLLSDGGQDLYVQIFYFTDRIAHLFWRFVDPEHPLYDPVRAERYRGELLAAYKRMDELVGRARELAGPDALFIVCSDHGFSSFRRGVNYNNWLVENGFMVLKPGVVGRPTLADVDWSRTRAYAIGLGAIYVNLIGRERQGIVLPGPEYAQLLREIRDELESLVDPRTGERAVARVWSRDEMYSRFDANLIPDLRAANSLNYRVSWGTTLGGFGDAVFEDNLNTWSGDHASSEPGLVPGVLLVNRPIRAANPRMIDLLPTVLEALGLETPSDLEGRSLL